MIVLIIKATLFDANTKRFEKVFYSMDFMKDLVKNSNKIIKERKFLVLKFIC